LRAALGAPAIGAQSSTKGSIKATNGHRCAA
jgi:hypothetical protein